jgi:hypothetical protein
MVHIRESSLAKNYSPVFTLRALVNEGFIQS